MKCVSPTLEDAAANLKALQNWFRAYIVVLGIMALQILAWVGRWMFEMPHPQEQEAFGIKWPPNYVSLALGLVFAMFVFVLLLHVQRSRQTVEPLLQDPENSKAMRRIIEWQAWLASPLRSDRCGCILFWGLLAIGWMRVALLVYGHAFGAPHPAGHLVAFRSIAAIDGFILIVTGYMMWRIRIETMAIASEAPIRKTTGH